jgi:hypothetical protein
VAKVVGIILYFVVEKTPEYNKHLWQYRDNQSQEDENRAITRNIVGSKFYQKMYSFQHSIHTLMVLSY